MHIASSAGIFFAMEEACRDRLPKQRAALHKPDLFFGFPPPRGGLRSWSGGAVCLAPEIANVFRTLIPVPTNSCVASHGY
jgi:hypothetical protein